MAETTTKEEKTKKAAEEKPANNIIFVGRRKRLNKETNKHESVPRDAPEFIQDGNDRIKLPAPEIQAKGFYHAEAARIIGLFPDDYKEFKPKG